jgi:hypothetical protein
MNGLISAWGKNRTVSRRGPSTVVKGRATAASPTTFTARMHVQQATAKELQRLPEGERSKDVRVGWSATPLRMTGAEGEADVVDIDGEAFEVSKTEPWEHPLSGEGFQRVWLTRKSR